MISLLNVSIQQKQAVSDFIHERFGLYFPPDRFADMLRALGRATEESGFESVSRYADWLLANQLSDKQLEPLITNLTIGETYFFRDSKLFSGLRDTVFPEIRNAGSNKKVRIWSAACSTGEEAYSLAILLDRSQCFPSDWQVDLFATDVNVKSLSKARAAEYSQWSFRGIDENLKSSYFSLVNRHRWKLIDRMRQKVEFAYLNLAVHPLQVNSSGGNLFDVILCRNVLMYFSTERRQQILSHLIKLLTPTGWLVVSPSEVGVVDLPELSIVDVDGMLMHRKGVASNIKKKPAVWRESGSKSKSAHKPQPKNHKPKVVASTVKAKPKNEVSSEPPKPSPEFDGLKSALALFDDREYHAAVECLVSLIDDETAAKTLSAEPVFLLARCLANLGQAEEAEEWLTKALERDRLNAAGYYLLSTIQQERGDLIQAKRSLEQSLYLDGDYVMATFAMGMLLVLHEQQKVQGAKMFARVKVLLGRLDSDDIVPDSGGLTVSHLYKMLESLT